MNGMLQESPCIAMSASDLSPAVGAQRLFFLVLDCRKEQCFLLSTLPTAVLLEEAMPSRLQPVQSNAPSPQSSNAQALADKLALLRTALVGQHVALVFEGGNPVRDYHAVVSHVVKELVALETSHVSVIEEGFDGCLSLYHKGHLELVSHLSPEVESSEQLLTGSSNIGAARESEPDALAHSRASMGSVQSKSKELAGEIGAQEDPAKAQAAAAEKAKEKSKGWSVKGMGFLSGGSSSNPPNSSVNPSTRTAGSGGFLSSAFSSSTSSGAKAGALPAAPATSGSKAMGFFSSAFSKAKNAPKEEDKPSSRPSNDSKGWTLLGSKTSADANEGSADAKFSIEEEDEEELQPSPPKVKVPHEIVQPTIEEQPPPVSSASKPSRGGIFSQLLRSSSSVVAAASPGGSTPEKRVETKEEVAPGSAKAIRPGSESGLCELELESEVDVGHWIDRPNAYVFSCKRVGQNGQCLPRHLIISDSPAVLMDVEAHRTKLNVASLKACNRLKDLDKVTFSKKDPDLLTLIFRSASGGKPWGLLYVVDKSQRGAVLEAIQATLKRMDQAAGGEQTSAGNGSAKEALEVDASASLASVEGNVDMSNDSPRHRVDDSADAGPVDAADQEDALTREGGMTSIGILGNNFENVSATNVHQLMDDEDERERRAVEAVQEKARAQLLGEATAAAKLEVEAAAAKEGEERAKREAQAAAAKEGEEPAKREAEAAAKREAEAAAAQREVLALAAKQAEELAKLDAAAAAKREAEAATEAHRAGPSIPVGAPRQIRSAARSPKTRRLSQSEAAKQAEVIGLQVGLTFSSPPKISSPSHHIVTIVT